MDVRPTVKTPLIGSVCGIVWMLPSLIRAIRKHQARLGNAFLFSGSIATTPIDQLNKSVANRINVHSGMVQLHTFHTLERFARKAEASHVDQVPKTCKHVAHPLLPFRVSQKLRMQWCKWSSLRPWNHSPWSRHPPRRKQASSRHAQSRRSARSSGKQTKRQCACFWFH